MYSDAKITHIFFCKQNNDFEILFTKFRNIIQVCKINTFQENLPTIFIKVLNLYLFSKIFQKVEIVILR